MICDLAFPDGDHERNRRAMRTLLPASSDWAVLPDAPTDTQAWEPSRQALRDFPSTWTPGPTAEFPDPPS